MKTIMKCLGIMKRHPLLVVLIFSFVFVSAGAATSAAMDTNSQKRAWTDGVPQNFDEGNLEQGGVFETTTAYVVQFYPLWFTYYQSFIVPPNRMVGPDRISPIYHIVVAINDDTLYASSLLNLKEDPVILTIPETAATYSILTLDAYGNIFDTGLVAGTPGIYALIGPENTKNIPKKFTPIGMPYNFMALIFRADKFSDNVDQTSEADEFRQSLKLATLHDYRRNHDAGTTAILPVIYFSAPFKTIADTLATKTPIRFLKQLQTAVGSGNTPPLSPYEQQLSDQFDSLFGNGEFNDQTEKAIFAAAVESAHALIVNRYLNHTGLTNWIHFTNIGSWGNQVIDRSAITEFIQYGNGIKTAAYYHAFKDGNNAPLNGGTREHSDSYVLTFSQENIPDALRFWSITAYTPDTVEPVFNSEDKYLVASYTPGLTYNSDGSLSIYMSQDLPEGVPKANWLPIPDGEFNIMLRIYGVVPDSDVADNSYVPPAIWPLGQ